MLVRETWHAFRLPRWRGGTEGGEAPLVRAAHSLPPAGGVGARGTRPRQAAHPNARPCEGHGRGAAGERRRASGPPDRQGPDASAATRARVEGHGAPHARQACAREPPAQTPVPGPAAAAPPAAAPAIAGTAALAPARAAAGAGDARAPGCAAPAVGAPTDSAAPGARPQLSAAGPHAATADTVAPRRTGGSSAPRRATAPRAGAPAVPTFAHHWQTIPHRACLCRTRCFRDCDLPA